MLDVNIEYINRLLAVDNITLVDMNDADKMLKTSPIVKHVARFEDKTGTAISTYKLNDGKVLIYFTKPLSWSELYKFVEKYFRTDTEEILRRYKASIQAFFGGDTREEDIETLAVYMFPLLLEEAEIGGKRDFMIQNVFITDQMDKRLQNLQNVVRNIADVVPDNFLKGNWDYVVEEAMELVKKNEKPMVVMKLQPKHYVEYISQLHDSPTLVLIAHEKCKSALQDQSKPLLQTEVSSCLAKQVNLGAMTSVTVKQLVLSTKLFTCKIGRNSTSKRVLYKYFEETIPRKYFVLSKVRCIAIKNDLKKKCYQKRWRHYYLRYRKTIVEVNKLEMEILQNSMKACVQYHVESLNQIERDNVKRSKVVKPAFVELAEIKKVLLKLRKKVKKSKSKSKVKRIREKNEKSETPINADDMTTELDKSLELKETAEEGDKMENDTSSAEKSTDSEEEEFDEMEAEVEKKLNDMMISLERSVDEFSWDNLYDGKEFETVDKLENDVFSETFSSGKSCWSYDCNKSAWGAVHLTSSKSIWTDNEDTVPLDSSLIEEAKKGAVIRPPSKCMQYAETPKSKTDKSDSKLENSQPSWNQFSPDYQPCITVWSPEDKFRNLIVNRSSHAFDSVSATERKKPFERPIVRNEKWLRKQVLRYFNPEDNTDHVTDMIIRVLCSSKRGNVLEQRLSYLLGPESVEFISNVVTYADEIVNSCNEQVKQRIRSVLGVEPEANNVDEVTFIRPRLNSRTSNIPQVEKSAFVVEDRPFTALVPQFDTPYTEFEQASHKGVVETTNAEKPDKVTEVLKVAFRDPLNVPDEITLSNTLSISLPPMEVASTSKREVPKVQKPTHKQKKTTFHPINIDDVIPPVPPIYDDHSVTTAAPPQEQTVYPHVYDYCRRIGREVDFVGGKQLSLPEGTTRRNTETYEEVTVPPPSVTSDDIDDLEELPISSLEKICQKAFEGISHLNKIQSIVFETAYKTNENLLICAPTGAGKTNIALLVMLREIKCHMEDDTLVDNDFKVVYLAPLKALATEMTKNFSRRLSPIGIKVVEVTGETNVSKAEMIDAQVLVATPEKWDVLSRKKDLEGTVANYVRTLIIDEVHLLHGDRGHVIEALVARTIRQVESSQKMIRLTGLSATLPNYVDVAQFLKVNLSKGLFYFDSRFRPVPLEQCFIGVKGRQKKQQRVDIDYICYEKVVSMLKKGCQVMVFVHARNATELTARAFRRYAQDLGHMAYFVPGEGKPGDDIQKAFRQARSRELIDLLQYGMSIHHAGLVRKDRLLVEKYFLEGVIRVLVCTSTLAWGVNLPAHCVIIKGTDVFDFMHGKVVDLGILDVLQIFGRAGRPQFEKSGKAIIITSYSKLHYYLSFLTDQFPIESSFISKLPENLNAEVVLGTIRNVEEGITWLSYTYMYVRMKINPFHYGLYPSDLQYDPDLLQKRRELISTTARKLDTARMVRFNEATGDLHVADTGRAASVYYICMNTISMFNETMCPSMDEKTILDMIANAEEFGQLKVRDAECEELDYLASHVPYPLSGGDNIREKVNLLIQVFVSRVSLSTTTLQSDLFYVGENVVRFARAFFEISVHRCCSSLANKFLTFAKMLERQQWDFESYFRQFSCIGPETIMKIEEHNLTIQRARDMDAKEIGGILRSYKSGEIVKKCAEAFPLPLMAANLQPVTKSILKIHLRIVNDFVWNDHIHGKHSLSYYLFIEDPEDNFICHWETFQLTKRQAKKSEPIDIIVIVPIYTPLPPMYYARAVSETWLGAEYVVPLHIGNLQLPEEGAWYTDLLPLNPLPITAIQRRQYEKLYTFTHFNAIQTQVFHCLYHTDNNVLLGAPTGSGKTIVAELAFFRVFQKYPRGKVVYIAPLKALVKERVADWERRFQKGLKKKVVELTGDITPDTREIVKSSIIVTTPEKWDSISRSWMSREYVRNVALVVIDEIHLLGEDRGPVLEVIVSRMNYMSSHTLYKPRIVGLSTALANPGDIASWLSIKKTGVYNFRSSVRPVPLEVHVMGFAGKYYCPRMASMNKPAYRAIKEYSRADPVLIFVSSRRQTRLTAFGLLAELSEEDNPKQWLHLRAYKVQKVVDKLKDPNLKLFVQLGIGIHHAGLQETDRKIVEDMFSNRNIQVLITTATLAWGINLPAHLVIIKGTEYYDGKLHRYVEMPVTDILQMMGRAGRPQFDTQAYAVVMVEESRKNFLKQFLYEPFPVESSLLNVLPEHFNAEIVAGTIQSTEDAFEYMKWTYFLRRVARNPSYYNVPSGGEEGLRKYINNIIECALCSLRDAKCIVYDTKTSGVQPTAFGRIASYYYISYKTMLHFHESLKGDMTVEQVLVALAHVNEYSEIPVRHNEDVLNSHLANLCPMAVDASTYDSPHTKTLLLLQAHFCRLPLPIEDYHIDKKLILDQAIRILQAMVDSCGENGWLTSVMSVLMVIQMVVQARWYNDFSILTLPHIEETHARMLYHYNISAVSLGGLSNLIRKTPDLLRHLFQDMFTAKQIDEIREVLDIIPLASFRSTLSNNEGGVSLSECGEFSGVSQEVLNYDNVPVDMMNSIKIHSGTTYVMNVTLFLERELKHRKTYAPHFPKIKDANWFLMMGDLEKHELISLKRVHIWSDEVTHSLKFCITKTGPITLTVFLVSDCYIGIDQQHNYKFDVL